MEDKHSKDDDDYFARMSRALFVAGLKWSVVYNKWPGFEKAFSNFSINKVSGFNEKDVKSLMKDDKIVRNEKKIRAVIYNAQEILNLKKEYGSFQKYVRSFKGDESLLITDLRSRFKFLGESTARMFLYMAGMKLTPTKEEMQWHSQHMKK